MTRQWPMLGGRRCRRVAACHYSRAAYARRCERQMEQMAALPLHAGGSLVALAGIIPAQLQRVLRAGFLRGRVLPPRYQVVAAAGDARSHRPGPGHLLPVVQHDAIGQLCRLRTHHPAGYAVQQSVPLPGIARGRDSRGDSLLPDHQHRLLAIRRRIHQRPGWLDQGADNRQVRLPPYD